MNENIDALKLMYIIHLYYIVFYIKLSYGYINFTKSFPFKFPNRSFVGQFFFLPKVTLIELGGRGFLIYILSIFSSYEYFCLTTSIQKHFLSKIMN